MTRALALLLMSDFARGWDGYELRRLDPRRAGAAVAAPEWDGSPLGGTLLVRDMECALKLWNRNGVWNTYVTLEGDVVTAADPEHGFRGAAEINLDTSDSYLHGLIGGWTDFATGQAVLSFSNGAAWIPRGTGTPCRARIDLAWYS